MVRKMRSAGVLLLCLLALGGASSGTCGDAPAAGDVAEGVQVEETEYSEELANLSAESDVTSLETASRGRRSGLLQSDGRKQQLVSVLGAVVGTLLLGLFVLLGVKRLVPTEEEKHAYGLVWNNRNFVYALLSEVYEIEGELSSKDVWRIARKRKGYLLEAEERVRRLVKKEECLPGSIPVAEILRVVKEDLLLTKKMHSRVNSNLRGVLGLYVSEGKVQGLRDAVQYHLESFYESAGKVVKTLPLSRSQKETILERVAPIIGRLPLEPAKEDLLLAHYEIGSFTRSFLTKGKLVLAEKAVEEKPPLPLPHFEGAELVFKHLFRNFEKSHPELEVDDPPDLVWREMVKQFLVNCNAQTSYEMRCQKKGEACVHISREATANAIIMRNLEESRQLHRLPLIAPPESSVLE